MKNKVVVFTENNARILINPSNIEAYKDKPKASVNPDLSLVNGVDPHFWKLIDYDFIELTDAVRIKDILSGLIDWTNEVPSHEETFRRECYFKLEEQIQTAAQASNIIAKMLPKARGIDRKELIEYLNEKLIVPSKSDQKIKENKLFKEMIDKWDESIIAPMDEDEKKLRAKHIDKHGANNKLIMKQKYGHIYLGIVSLVLAILTAVWMFKKH